MTASTGRSPSAKANAINGISKAPGTQPTAISLRSTPASRRTSSAPSRSRVVRAPLKRLQTSATRTPRPTGEPSRCSPTRFCNSWTRRESTCVSSLDVIESSEQVTETLALRAQIVDVEGRRAAFERHALDDIQAEALEAAVLRGGVGHDAHRSDAEVDEYLRADAVLACVDRTSEIEVGVDGVATFLLKGVGTNLMPEANAASFVSPQVHDDAGAFGRDLRESRFQLRAAVTTHRAEHVAGQTFGVNPNEHVASRGDVAVDQRHVLLAVEDVLKHEGLELTVLGRHRRLCDSLHQLLVSASVANQVGD